MIDPPFVINPSCINFFNFYYSYFHSCLSFIFIMFKTKISTTYIDIPVNIQETPAFVLEKLTTYVIPEDSIDMGLDFIERLTTVIKSQDNQH